MVDNDLTWHLNRLEKDEIIKRKRHDELKGKLQETWDKLVNIKSHIHSVRTDIENATLEEIGEEINLPGSKLNVASLENDYSTLSVMSANRVSEITTLKEKIRYKEAMKRHKSLIEEKLNNVRHDMTSKTEELTQISDTFLKPQLDPTSSKSVMMNVYGSEMYSMASKLRQELLELYREIEDLEREYTQATNTLNTLETEVAVALRLSHHEQQQSLLQQQFHSNHQSVNISTRYDLTSTIASYKRELFPEFGIVSNEIRKSNNNLSVVGVGTIAENSSMDVNLTVDEVLSGNANVLRLNGESAVMYKQRLEKRLGTLLTIERQLEDDVTRLTEEVKHAKDELRDTEVKRLRLELQISKYQPVSISRPIESSRAPMLTDHRPQLIQQHSSSPMLLENKLDHSAIAHEDGDMSEDQSLDRSLLLLLHERLDRRERADVVAANAAKMKQQAKWQKETLPLLEDEIPDEFIRQHVKVGQTKSTKSNESYLPPPPPSSSSSSLLSPSTTLELSPNDNTMVYDVPESPTKREEVVMAALDALSSKRKGMGSTDSMDSNDSIKDTPITITNIPKHSSSVTMKSTAMNTVDSSVLKYGKIITVSPTSSNTNMKTKSSLSSLPISITTPKSKKMKDISTETDEMDQMNTMSEYSSKIENMSEENIVTKNKKDVKPSYIKPPTPKSTSNANHSKVSKKPKEAMINMSASPIESPISSPILSPTTSVMNQTTPVFTESIKKIESGHIIKSPSTARSVSPTGKGQAGKGHISRIPRPSPRIHTLMNEKLSPTSEILTSTFSSTKSINKSSKPSHFFPDHSSSNHNDNNNMTDTDTSTKLEENDISQDNRNLDNQTEKRKETGKPKEKGMENEKIEKQTRPNISSSVLNAIETTPLTEENLNKNNHSYNSHIPTSPNIKVISISTKSHSDDQSNHSIQPQTKVSNETKSVTSSENLSIAMKSSKGRPSTPLRSTPKSTKSQTQSHLESSSSSTFSTPTNKDLNSIHRFHKPLDPEEILLQQQYDANLRKRLGIGGSGVFGVNSEYNYDFYSDLGNRRQENRMAVNVVVSRLELLAQEIEKHRERVLHHQTNFSTGFNLTNNTNSTTISSTYAYHGSSKGQSPSSVHPKGSLKGDGIYNDGTYRVPAAEIRNKMNQSILLHIDKNKMENHESLSLSAEYCSLLLDAISEQREEINRNLAEKEQSYLSSSSNSNNHLQSLHPQGSDIDNMKMDDNRMDNSYDENVMIGLDISMNEDFNSPKPNKSNRNSNNNNNNENSKLLLENKLEDVSEEASSLLTDSIRKISLKAKRRLSNSNKLDPNSTIEVSESDKDVMGGVAMDQLLLAAAIAIDEAEERHIDLLEKSPVIMSNLMNQENNLPTGNERIGFLGPSSALAAVKALTPIKVPIPFPDSNTMISSSPKTNTITLPKITENAVINRESSMVPSIDGTTMAKDGLDIDTLVSSSTQAITRRRLFAGDIIEEPQPISNPSHTIVPARLSNGSNSNGSSSSGSNNSNSNSNSNDGAVNEIHGNPSHSKNSLTNHNQQVLLMSEIITTTGTADEIMLLEHKINSLDTKISTLERTETVDPITGIVIDPKTGLSMGKLDVVVINAKNLPAMRRLDKSTDPYVEVTVIHIKYLEEELSLVATAGNDMTGMGSGLDEQKYDSPTRTKYMQSALKKGITRRTSTKYCNLHPNWREGLLLAPIQDSLMEQEVIVTIRHCKKSIEEDDIIGSCSFPLSMLTRSSSHTYQLYLQQPPHMLSLVGRMPDTCHCKVTFRLTYSPLKKLQRQRNGMIQQLEAMKLRKQLIDSVTEYNQIYPNHSPKANTMSLNPMLSNLMLSDKMTSSSAMNADSMSGNQPVITTKLSIQTSQGSNNISNVLGSVRSPLTVKNNKREYSNYNIHQNNSSSANTNSSSNPMGNFSPNNRTVHAKDFMPLSISKPKAMSVLTSVPVQTSMPVSVPIEGKSKFPGGRKTRVLSLEQRVVQS